MIYRYRVQVYERRNKRSRLQCLQRRFVRTWNKMIDKYGIDFCNVNVEIDKNIIIECDGNCDACNDENKTDV